MKQRLLVLGTLCAVLTGLFVTVGFSSRASALTQKSGSVGIEATIPTNPPTQAPTISVPSNGQNFSNIPITVSGLCKTDLLIEVFKNNVFAGSVKCVHSSYSLQIDLFSDRNDLVARQYDDLNQASPDSNIVTVTFTQNFVSFRPRLSITSSYAKRGANPSADPPLTWPITISGGVAPYAISVDWGDKSTPDLLISKLPGDLNLQHTYKLSGIYNVIIKGTDSSGETAFLQVVGIALGKIQQAASTGQIGSTTSSGAFPLALWIALAMIPIVLISSFWLGKKHQLQTIRSRLRSGKSPI